MEECPLKPNVRLICRTALLLALCVAAQFLKNTSVYLTGPIINAIIILATLSCGLWSGAVLSVLTPLTSWWITGSPVMSAYPLTVPCIMLGNLILCLFVWLFGVRLAARLPETQKLALSDAQFRSGIVVALVAAALWGGIGIAFLASFGELVQLSLTPLLLVLLISLGGCFVLFAGLWVLAAKLPRSWTLIAGLVFGSAVKALFLWLTISRGILTGASELPAQAVAVAKTTFSVTQLLTALLGSAIAFLVWLPLHKLLQRGTAQ